MIDLTLEGAKKADLADPLAGFRERFYLLPETIYMDGNSLGLASRDAEQALLNALEQWKTLGINGWMDADPAWFYLAETLGAMQTALVGAKPEELLVAGSTTINLHQLVSTFYQPEGKRTKILTDELNFPSDHYALQSQVLLRGYDPSEHLVVVKSRDGRTIEEDDIIAAMTDEIALIMLPAVLYRSGQLLDLKRLTEEAHQRGIVIGFDCCHSIGAVPHRFDEWDVDFAFWCNYKYLNGGPGSTASLYVNERHFNKRPGLAGWFGYRKDKQFDMIFDFEGAPNAGAWQIGTTHLFSSAPLLGSLNIFQEAGIERVREKSLQQTAYMMALLDELPAELGYTIGNPREEARRGGHVSLEHPEAIRICKALKARGVIPDFRFPNVIRLAPIALYTSFEDVYNTVQILRDIVETRAYEQFAEGREVVA